MQLLKNLISVIVLFVSVSSHAQTPVKTYSAQWKRVEDLVSQKNLPQSALVEVKKIYELAKKEKQNAQIIKAVIYMVGLQSDTRENSEVLSIKDIEKEISISKEPVVSIFKSLLA